MSSYLCILTRYGGSILYGRSYYISWRKFYKANIKA